MVDMNIRRMMDVSDVGARLDADANTESVRIGR